MSFLSSLFNAPPNEERETDTLIATVRRGQTESLLRTEEAEDDFMMSVMEEAATALDSSVGNRLGQPVYALIATLLAHERFNLPCIVERSHLSLAEGVDYRNRLRRATRIQANEQYFLNKWKEALGAILAALYRGFPQHAFVDPDEQGNFEEYSRLAPVAPLYSYIGNVPVLIRIIFATVLADDLIDDQLFEDLREQLLINLANVSNISLHDLKSGNRAYVLPEDKRGVSSEELIGLYLSGTPFLEVFHTDIPLYIPEAVRFEHTHVLAGTGHGKTQTLQYLIAGDLERALVEKRSVVVMDSQGDLLQTLMHCPYFRDAGLRDRFVYIDPQDMERPVGLNLFDVDLSSTGVSGPVVRETIINGTVELYEYFFGGLLGSELTQKQGLVFRYLATLMTRIPQANIHTLLELMENGEKYKPHMQSLEGSARVFFETRFFDRTFSETKKQILTRLWGVLSNQTLDRMMSATKNSVDLFHALQDGSIIFINTAKDFLGHEGSSIFSRMFVALLGQALMRRAAVAKHDRTPTYLYFDEAEDIVDVTLTRLLTQVRKYKGAITFAHQNLDQLEPSIRAGVLANTSIKLAGGVSAKDAHALTNDFRCDTEFLLSQRKNRNTTNFACYARNVTDHAVALSIPLGYLESKERLSHYEYQALVETSRMKYGNPARAKEPTVVTPRDAESNVVSSVLDATPAAEIPEQPLKTQDAASAENAPDIVIARAPPTSAPTLPRDIGGGGAKHRYLEHLIKELGEERGFRASIEEAVHDGTGRVDVILRREKLNIAFEISVTTTRDHELCNIEKCLALDFEHVVMVASHQRHLTSLSKFIGPALEDIDRKRVSFLLPEHLPDFLDGYPANTAPAIRTVKGYTVRSRVSDVSSGEAIARRKAIAAVVARTIHA